MPFVPLKVWLGPAILAALMVAVGVYGHHEYERGRDDSQAELQKTADVAAARSVDETQRRVSAAKDIAHAAEIQASAARADAATARAAADRLRQRVAAASRRAATSDPAAADPGAPAGGTGAVPVDLFSRVLDVAGQFAAVADQARVAGLACEAAYDSLNPQP